MVLRVGIFLIILVARGNEARRDCVRTFDRSKCAV